MSVIKRWTCVVRRQVISSVVGTHFNKRVCRNSLRAPANNVFLSVTPKLAISSRRNWRVAVVSVMFGGLIACASSDNDSPDAPPAAALETFEVTMTSDQEVPSIATSATVGKATLTLDRSTRTISAKITVEGTTPTLAHIHAAAAGSDGQVVLPMTVAGNTATLPSTVLTTDQLATLDDGGFYFNVHSATYPDGEIRGQIGREVYVAHMTGSQETAAVESAATGEGLLVLDPKNLTVSGQIELSGIEATAAHVHVAAFGADGAILIPLEDHGGHNHFTIPSGTVINAQEVEYLREGGMYFNAHSTAHPGGEIRGQIGRRIFLAAVTGGQEVPSTPSVATGKGFVTYDAASRSIDGALKLTGITATAAHIHQAAAGTNGAIIVPLTPVTPGSSDWLVPNTASPLTLEQAQALMIEGLYYNAHSSAFPNGEIRGQLRAAGDDGVPIVHIVSPAAGVSVARGKGVLNAGSFDGTGFSINLEMITRDEVGIAAEEGLNIRNTSLLGQPNPKMPTLVVTIDADFIKPDGTVIPKGTNLASLFNIAGSDDTAGPGITLWAGWHVLESFPEDTNTVTITASIVDQSGRKAVDHVTYSVLPGHDSGQSLTPQTAGVAGDGIDDPQGPVVTMIAPRPNSSVSTGPRTGLPTPPSNSSLMFIQVSALDTTTAGIAVNENAEGKADPDRGTIVDGTQIGAHGPNRNYPGLSFTFDVPLLQPNGNLVPAGQNLAPLFNIVGSERDLGGVRTTAGWVIGGTLVIPDGKNTVTSVARVTDSAGFSGSTAHTFGISEIENGQALTPQPLP